MSTMTFNEIDIQLDGDGHLVNKEDWNEELAAELAKRVDIAELTDRHWIVIKFIQDKYAEKGEIPTIRTIKNESGVETKELYKLFPKGPIKKASKIAGLPKPVSCI